eukprot:364848-Chlamydomonas_euryale.AAC.13
MSLPVFAAVRITSAAAAVSSAGGRSASSLALLDWFRRGVGPTTSCTAAPTLQQHLSYPSPRLAPAGGMARVGRSKVQAAAWVPVCTAPVHLDVQQGDTRARGVHGARRRVGKRRRDAACGGGRGAPRVAPTFELHTLEWHFITPVCVSVYACVDEHDADHQEQGLSSGTDVALYKLACPQLSTRTVSVVMAALRGRRGCQSVPSPAEPYQSWAL